MGEGDSFAEASGTCVRVNISEQGIAVIIARTRTEVDGGRFVSIVAVERFWFIKRLDIFR